MPLQSHQLLGIQVDSPPSSEASLPVYASPMPPGQLSFEQGAPGDTSLSLFPPPLVSTPPVLLDFGYAHSPQHQC